MNTHPVAARPGGPFRLCYWLLGAGLLLGLAGCGGPVASTPSPVSEVGGGQAAPAAPTLGDTVQPTLPPLLPTATLPPLPATATSDMIPPTDTLPPVPATATDNVPPVTETPMPPPATDTALPPTDTPAPPPPDTPRPVAPTHTPRPVAPTKAATKAPTRVPAPPSPTRAPAPPTPAEAAAQPPTPAAPPVAPGERDPYATPLVELTPPVVDQSAYTAYIPAAMKSRQFSHYSCEFDAAWVVLKTYGFDPSVEELIDIIGVDHSVEPYYEETPKGAVIYGGDIRRYYSGDYRTNFLGRSSGQAMSKVFTHYGLRVTPVHDKASLEAALRGGSLVWIKTTADFKPGVPATWIMPDGSSYQTVLGNDHAVVVMGYNATGALIRDVLGPTKTNWNRPYEYLVPWAKFLAAWKQQSYDGLAVAPAR